MLASIETAAILFILGIAFLEDQHALVDRLQILEDKLFVQPG